MPPPAASGNRSSKPVCEGSTPSGGTMKLKEMLMPVLSALFGSLLGFLIILAVPGCEKQSFEGKVVGKEFTPAHTDSSLMMMPDGNGGFIWIPTSTSYPDSYYLKVWCSDDRVRSVSVSKEYYLSAKEGDSYKSP